MNLRDRLAPQKEEKNESYIRFDFDGGGVNSSIHCSKKELAVWMWNLMRMCNEIIQDQYDEKIQKAIISQRIEDMKNLYLNDEEC